MIQAVCFDMDGVLVDTERLGGTLLAMAAHLPSDALSDSQWRSLCGTSMQDTCNAMERWFPGRIDREALIAAWPRVTLDYIRKNGLPVKPGADETLRSLKAKGIGLALCTSNEPEVVQEYLKTGGWHSMFDFVVTARDIVHGKPAPDIYLKAARRMGVTPSVCAGVEDSVHGVHAVHAAGMYSVMVPDMIPYTHQLSQQVDVVIPDLFSLEAALCLK